jgi:hypothetical protein
MWLEMFDAGTTLVIDPLDDTPGMDAAYFRELDMERQFPTERQDDINDLLVDTPFSGFLRPWPEGFPWRMWMDYTDRHRGDYGGPKFTLYNWDDYSGDFSPVPAATAEVVTPTLYDPGASVDDARATDWLTSKEIEVAAGSDDPTTWLRLPLRNEVGGRDGHNCDLLNRVVITQNAHSGPHYKLVGDYNPIFAPFDLRRPEWYDLVDSQGHPLDLDAAGMIKDQLCSILNDSSYRIYVRPANWRWVVTVTAYYYYVSWWEFFLTKEIFTHAYFNRPPIYPHRHNLLKTTRTQDLEFDNVYWSLDAGIDDGFHRSRGAQFLRQQIVDAQWWTYSEAYILAGNDPAKLYLWMWPPEQGDIVLGIGNVDHITGQQQTVWFKQNRDLETYTRGIIGTYLIMDFVAAQGF